MDIKKRRLIVIRQSSIFTLIGEWKTILLNKNREKEKRIINPTTEK